MLLRCLAQCYIAFVLLALRVRAQFPKEKDPATYKYNIDTRYEELIPMLNSATYTAEKFMNRTGFFNLMGGRLETRNSRRVCKPVDSHSHTLLFCAVRPGIWSVPDEVKYYYRLANLPGVNTICDIGFNAGHSAITFLSANPNATVISFDICKMPWTLNSVGYVKSLFGDRFKFVKGHSGQMMTAAMKDKSLMFHRKCDLVSVDGDHSAAW
jgi:hypothetical protein